MNSDIMSGIERQIFVLIAIVRRELQIRIAGRSLGWIEEVGSITVHTLAFTFMRVALGVTSHHGMAVIPFTFTGVMTYWLFKTGITSVYSSSMIVSRYVEFPQVTLLDIALSRAMVNMFIYISFAYIVFFFLTITGFSPLLKDGLIVFVWLLTGGVFGAACGLVLMWPFHLFPIFRTVIMAAVFRTIALISGTFFVYSDLPLAIRGYAAWFPLLHINDKLRAAYFSTFSADWASPSYVAFWVICTFALGLISCEGMRRYLRG